MTQEDKSSDTIQGNKITNIAEARRKKSKALKQISYTKTHDEPCDFNDAITGLCESLLNIPNGDVVFAPPATLRNQKGEVDSRFCFLDGDLAIHDLAENTVMELTPEKNIGFAEIAIRTVKEHAAEVVGPEYLMGLNLSTKHQNELRNRMLAMAATCGSYFTAIPAILEKSAPGVCRNRLPYDITAMDFDDAMGKAPNWKAYLDRTSDALSVCQFIYELCTAQGSYKQSLWIHGVTDAGKSTLAIVISEIFDHEKACVILNAKTELSHGHTRFLVSKMNGAALVCWDDAHASLASNAEFKAFTGSRLQSLEEKGRKAMPVTLSCRHMITSNPPPEYRLDDEKEAMAMANRFIEVEITEAEKPKDWDAWKTALKKEFQWVLAAGKRAFLDKHIESKCKERIDSQVTKSYGRDDMNDFLSDFEYCKGAKLYAKNLRNYLSIRDYKSNNDINKFKLILTRHFKTRDVRRSEDRYIENVKMR